MHQSRSKISAKTAVMLTGIVLIVSFVTVFLTKSLTAGFNKPDVLPHVEIDGINYGAFEPLDNMDELVSLEFSSNDYAIISLERSFITDRSLYVWAKDTISQRKGLQNIHLVMRTEEGVEVSRYVMQSCQPISWSLAMTDQSTGGFYEKIDVTVQKVEIN